MVAMVMVCAGVGVASAQAPGEMPPSAVPTQPGAQPGVIAQPGVMDERWAVALSLAPETITAQVDAAPQIHFTTLELSGRYRILPALEGAVTLVAGGASSGTNLQEGGFFVDARYRIKPASAWNGIVDAGLGALSMASPNAINADRKARPAIRIGGGVERRFGALGISASLFIIAVGANMSSTDSGPNMTANQLARESLGGGGLTLCGAYYF